MLQSGFLPLICKLLHGFPFSRSVPIRPCSFLQLLLQFFKVLLLHTVLLRDGVDGVSGPFVILMCIWTDVAAVIKLKYKIK